MPRQRMLHPNFFTDVEIVALRPLARLLFQGLWCWADRAGVLEDKPRELKLRILPCDDINIEALLADLVAAGRICRFTVDGKSYIAVRNFGRYQHPHKNEKPSGLPPPPGQWPEIPTLAKSTERSGNYPANRAESVTESVTESESVPKSVTDRPRALGAPADVGDALAFWRWFQDSRVEHAGLVREKYPHPNKLNAFYSEALCELGGKLERLKAAVIAFGEDPYWEQRGYPFDGFVSAWRKYVPRAA